MRLKYLLLSVFVIFCSSLFILVKVIKAQSGPVNGDKVGPELADGTAGKNVVDRNGFKGTVAVINAVADSVSNTVPSKSNNPVALRLLMDSSVTVNDLIGYAGRFNPNATREFPNGAIVILGNELNNLSAEWKNTNMGLFEAGQEYATRFNAFSQNITLNHDKYKVAPAPPDMYNGDYDPMEWLNGFISTVNCNAIDTLVANVFKVQAAAKSVGGDVLKTYLVYQNKINSKCPGKTVTHFEGWGSDPRASVLDQVNFLNTQSLPVNSATTLIVDNCDGTFGGNGIKPWLYYIPKPPYVFRADGTALDPQTCSGTTTTDLTKNPFTPKDIACDSHASSYKDEYHSLRPYPASACNPKVEETALLCGNDLIVKKTFKDLTRDSAQSCSAVAPDGSFTCNYSLTGQSSNVTINLKNAELPILGNTELVANSTDRNYIDTKRSYISYGQRMNEYVSWFLNGAIDRAEEQFIKIPDSVDNLINYSGPLRKLFPWAIQIQQGLKTASEIYTKRHDQTVGCVANGNPVPCSMPEVEALQQTSGDNTLGLGAEDIYRLFNYKNSSDRIPLETAFKSFQDYWKSYLLWRGSICSPSLLGYFICSDGVIARFLASFFPYIPESSTEDRKGEVITDNNVTNPQTGKPELAHTIQLKEGEGNGGTVTNVSFSPTTDSHNLYFAHTEEIAQLGQLLQSTFATKSDSANNWEARLKRDVDINDPDKEAPLFNTYGCNRQDVRINPGDNLYGDLPKDGNQITGNLNYDVSFSCKFEPPKLDQGCYNTCTTSPDVTSGKKTVAQCQSECTTQTKCDKEIYVSLGIYTKTPKIQEVWDRLVNGEMAVFKRFFPKVGADSPVDTIKDLPGASKVIYASTTDEAKAGMTGRGGDEAQLFFPHIGGLQEYFLQGIQKALRPKDITETAISGQPQLACQPKDPEHINQVSDMTITDGVIGLAIQVAKRTCTPPEMLIGVLAQETRGRTIVSFNPLEEEPISGDPNQTVARTRQCFNGNLDDPIECGPYSWTPLSNYQAQFNAFKQAATDCFNAIGVTSNLDQRITGQAMCITAAKFWFSIRDADSSIPPCTDENQKMYDLSQITQDSIDRAFLHFCGVGRDKCQPAINTYNNRTNQFKDAVARVKSEVASCQK